MLNEYFDLPSFNSKNSLIDKHTSLEVAFNLLNEEKAREGFTNFFNDTSSYTQLLGNNIALPTMNKNLQWGKFIGNKQIIPRKQVVNSFVNPTESIKKPMEILSIDNVKRHIETSTRLNNQKPFESLFVRPGVGKDPYDNTVSGIHPTFRVLPKNIDQLRGIENKQITYTPLPINGQKGSIPGLLGSVKNIKPQTFKQNKIVELEKSGGIETKQAIYPKFKLNITNKDKSIKSYQGSAQSQTKKNISNFENYQESSKNIYKSPNIGHSKYNTETYLNNSASIIIEDNNRSTTSNNFFINFN